ARCGAVALYANASRTPSHAAGGRGAASRASPTGGAAYGIPRNADVPSSTWPRTTPLLVLTSGFMATFLACLSGHRVCQPVAMPPLHFRFAVDLQAPLADRSWADSAREVESLGYSTLFVPDHFDEGFGPLVALAVAATVTSTINVGPLVFDCDFRHPAV